MYKFKEFLPVIADVNDIQYKKSKALGNFIKSNYFDNNDNNLIALYGEWGSGKSTVFKTLGNELSKDKYIPLIFETWKYEKDKNLPLSLYDFILDNIINNKKAFSRILKKSTRKALYSFAKGISLNLGSVVSISGSEIMNELEKEDQNSLYTMTENFIDDFQKQIDTYIEDKKIIVFIDDLDRCEDESVVTLISALKLLFYLKNIIFICGIDKDAVISSFETKFLGSDSKKEKAEKFLDKIFPIDFNLEVEKMNIINQCDKDFPNLKIKIMKTISIKNPRQITKIFNKYLFLINIMNLNLKDTDLEKNIILRLKKMTIFIFVACKYNDFSFRDKEFFNSFNISTSNGMNFEGRFYDKLSPGSSPKVLILSHETIFENFKGKEILYLQKKLSFLNENFMEELKSIY